MGKPPLFRGYPSTRVQFMQFIRLPLQSLALAQMSLPAVGFASVVCVWLCQY